MFVFRAFLVVFAVLTAWRPNARAETCSVEPAAEEAGTHRCYEAGNHGRVHVWIPEGFDRKTAVTVVYAHGFRLGGDHCPQAGYLDCLWYAHGLAHQFSKSGLNALFVAVDSPVRPGQRVKWGSLDALLRFVRRRSGFALPVPVIAVAHSAGIRTVTRFLGEARLRHVIVLDALYNDSARRLENWYRASKRRRLTLVGAQSRSARTLALGNKLLCERKSDLFGPYSAARCVAAVDADYGHMHVVTDGKILPAVLAREAR